MQVHTTPLSYFVSLFTGIGSFMVNNASSIGIWVGICGVIGTFIINWVYKKKNYELERTRLDLEISRDLNSN